MASAPNATSLELAYVPYYFKMGWLKRRKHTDVEFTVSDRVGTGSDLLGEFDEAVRQCRAGQGASALVNSENAMLSMLSRFDDDEPFTVEMALALSRHAEVLHRFGDPDLAVAAADLAIRTFLNRGDEINRTVTARQLYVPAFIQAGVIAADIHERFGRDSTAASARKFTTQAAGLLTSVTVEPPLPLLADMTLHRCFDRVPRSDGEPSIPTVLYLETQSTVTSPATNCSLITSSARCADDQVLRVAEILAAAVAATTAADPAAALRLGLEVHVLYARQSELQIPEMRYNMGEHGPRWAQTLLSCSRIAEQQELRELALDLASWMAGVLNALGPFGLIDPGTRSIMRECLGWHVEILTKSGDTQGAAEAAQALSAIDSPA